MIDLGDKVNTAYQARSLAEEFGVTAIEECNANSLRSEDGDHRVRAVVCTVPSKANFQLDSNVMEHKVKVKDSKQS